MIFSRILSLMLRVGELIFAAVVLGLDAYLIHLHHKYNVGPLGREIYVLVISVLALLLSLAWMFPTKMHMGHVSADIFTSLAWFAAFGVLVNYLHKINCSSYFTWSNLTHGSQCDKWQAAEAFSFLSAIFWATSALLALWVMRGNRTSNNTIRRGDRAVV